MENHDIDDLVEGKGVLNWEHSNKGEDIIGAVIYARKILKKEECENDRQRKYWDFVKKPFVYIIGELFEDEEHPGAIAVAAMIRYYAKHNERLLTGFSIEGATLERRDYILQESVGRRVAVTLRPCNHTAIAGLLEDPKAKKIAKDIEKMSKSIDESLIEVDSIILEDMFMPKDPIMDLYKALEELNKALEAGMGNVAPSQLTGQAALTREHITGFQRNRVKAAVRDWDRKRPLKEVVKAALPEVDDEYIHHFSQLAEELALKKSRASKLIRVGNAHSDNRFSNDDQKKLIEGLYFNQKNPDANQFEPKHDEYSNALYKLKNDAGQHVLVKNPRSGAGLDDEISAGRPHDNAQASTHYYHLANEVFGMGKHVPITNYFQHRDLYPPHFSPGAPWSSGKYHQAMEIVPKSKALIMANSKDRNKLKAHHDETGEDHKLMMMDSILGNIDRHVGNVLIHPKGHLVNIDNDLAFSPPHQSIPSYIGNPEDNDEEAGLVDKLHPKAIEWINSIDPKNLAGKMLDQGHPPATVRSAVGGLKMWQRLSKTSHSVNHMHNIVHAQMTAMRNENPKPAVEQKKAV